MARTGYQNQLTQREIDMLHECRDAVRNSEEYAVQLEEARHSRDGLRSPNMDGMPRGMCSGDGTAKGLAAREDVRRRADRAKKHADRMREKARRIADKLPPDLYSTAIAYYVQAMTIEAAAAWLRVDESTIKRRRRRIEGKEKEP